MIRTRHLQAVALAFVLPASTFAQVAFPKPSGPHPVGTTLFHWTDSDRDETMTPEDGDKRELMVQLWYPVAKGAKGKRTKYLPHFDELRTVLSNYFRSHERKFKRAEAPALVDAPPLPKKLPVIVFSHGLGTGRLFYTGQILDLASHGYVVASLDHTYDVEGIVFPGPRLVERLDAASSNAEKVANAAAAATGSKPASARLKVWAQDLSYVVDQLEKLNREKGGRFYRRLDLSKLGMLGHCYGAEAAMLACSRDKRFKAVANQNGWPPATEVVEAGLKQPLLFQWGELSSAVVYLKDTGVAKEALQALKLHFENLQAKVLEKLGTKVYRVDVLEQKHMDFTDMPMLAEWVERKGLDVPMQQNPRVPIVAGFTRDFFDSTLRRKRMKLLTKPADKHEGATVRIFDPSRAQKKRKKKRG